MALSDATVSNVRALRKGADLVVTWDSSGPAGTPFQIYLDRKLAWGGTPSRLRQVLPVPARSRGEVFVGTCLASEVNQDLSGSIPAPPGGGTRPNLQWRGGRYLDEDIAGFRVYAGIAPAGSVDYTRAFADLPAYPQGIYTDGAGRGGAGRGGAGRSASSYSWTGDPLTASGTWNFAVRAYDTAGNEAAATTFSVAVTVPPAAPKPDAAGDRLRHVLHPDRAVTLSWTAP